MDEESISFEFKNSKKKKDSKILFNMYNLSDHLSDEEEKVIRVSANLIHNTYTGPNMYIKPKQMTEETLKELIQNIFELNEE